jgi:hypothetical protein
MGIMTTRRLRLALLGFSLTVAVVYVPACEYDTGTGPSKPQASPTYTRLAEPSPGAVHG